MAVSLLYLSLVFSGVLDIWRDSYTGGHSYRLWSNDEIIAAQKLRQISGPTDRVLVTDANNHWVSCLTGRQILLGYRGWMWTYGIDYSQVYADMRVMFAGGPAAEALLRHYDIAYVVIGPHERYSDAYDANELYFAQRYPLVMSQADINVYDVRQPLAEAAGEVSSPALPDGVQVVDVEW